MKKRVLILCTGNSARSQMAEGLLEHDAGARLTWVVWRHEWPFDHGKHTFSVRCYEGNGTPQVATPSPVEPSGATGLYSKTEMF